jgi:nucleoside-diphosphate-sugar epimerase
MKIFLTGGTGFIGSHVAEEAIKRNCSVKILRRGVSTIRTNLSARVNYLNVDLDKLTPKDLQGFNVLIHLAAEGISPKKASFDEIMYWNVTASTRLLQVALDAGIERLVLAGTYSEYGKTANQYDSIPWNAPLQPISSYAVSKAAFFHIANNFAIEHKVPLAYLRVFSAFGPFQNPENLFPSLVLAALEGRDFAMSSGEQIRDFVSVEQVAKRLVEAATSITLEAGLPMIRNIGSGRGTSVRDFAKEQWKMLAAKGQLIFGAIPNRSDEPFRYVARLEEPFK